MSLLEVFRSQKTKNQTAAIARERLQIIVAHERCVRDAPSYLQDMKQDILTVVRKYVEADQEDVKITFDHRHDISILEMNVTLTH